MAGDLVRLPLLMRNLPEGDEPGGMGFLLQRNADMYPDRPALLFEDQTITWGDFNERSNQFARMLAESNITKGDVVTLLMENRIEFLIALLAISKCGAVAGLINTNLRDHSLAHCIKLIDSKMCIVGQELTDALADVKDELSMQDGRDYIFIEDAGNGASTTECPNWAINFPVYMNNLDSSNLDTASMLPIDRKEVFIFTSGTTGLPKAAVFSAQRFHKSSFLLAKSLIKTRADDRLYNCLPLYHSAGLMIGFGSTLQTGTSMFIRRKFSATNFLAEVRQYNTTVFLYIGELCRYLLSLPEHADDSDNPLRTIVGNGLRPDIWMEFKNRFGIERVGEFYGASEGNGAFINIFNRDKTVGTTPLPAKLVEYNVPDDEIILDDTGYCIPVKRGEPGLLLFEITGDTPFEGYSSNDATEKKIIRNAFKQGDAYFNSGDLLKEVDVGFTFGLKHYQFADRVGDTFRWKGENVSTNEVGEIINGFTGVETTNVYGVEIPETDGRAGMAAIQFLANENQEKPLDIKALSDYIINSLPVYARPVFIRILSDDVDSTTTFKMMKGRLREEGYDPNKCLDDVLVLKPGAESYVPLDKSFYDTILDGDAAY